MIGFPRRPARPFRVPVDFGFHDRIRGQGNFMKGQPEGLSLVEVVVALSVLALVAAVSLPALHRAQNAARMTQCQDHLRRISAGVLNYEQKHKFFPPGQMSTKFITAANNGNLTDPAEPTGASGNGQGTSWMVHILPLIDQQALYGAWKFNRNVAANRDAAASDIEIFYCPSRRAGVSVAAYPNVRRVDSGWTGGGNDYAGCAGSGIVFDDKTRGTYALVPAQLESTLGRDGWSPFNQQAENIGIFTVNSATKVADIGDGASQTILVSERRLTDFAGPESQISSDGWAWGGPATLFSCRVAPHQGVNVPASAAELGHFDSADGPHAGVVQVAFADGGVRAVNINISLSVWRDLGSINGGVPARVPD